MNYIPDFESQRDENAPLPWTNCTLSAAAMLLDQWSYGRVGTSDIALRAASGVNRRQGVNFAGTARAIGRLFDMPLMYSEADGSGPAPLTWAALRTHLANDGSAVVCGSYASLRGWTAVDGKPLDRWQPGASFGHAVHVVDYDPESVSVLWQDPLGHGTYQGDRIPLDALWAYIWKQGQDASARVTAAHAFDDPRPPRRETRGEREARLAAEVVRARRVKPKALARWLARTGLTEDLDGKPITRSIRLAAEVSHFREAPAE